MGDESKGKGSRIRFAAEDPAIPKPWRALVDGSTGFLYFWNPHTNVTQYERPEYAANPSPNPRLEEESSKHQEKIQVLVDEYNATLRAKKQEFKLEMEKKRKYFDEEIKRKLDAVDKEKKEISYKEEKISKIEQSFKNELEKLEINEEVIKTKLEALKKWEESLKAEEKKLGEEKQKLMTESQDLVVSRTELESLRAAMKAEQEQIILSKENLELTKVEREEHLKLLRVQTKLKQEIEYWMMKSCSLTKESDALREKVKKFERECEMRDDKRMALQTEVERIGDEKESFDNWLRNELEKLKNGGLQASADIQELEDGRLRRDTLENIMVQQQSTACAEDSQHIDEESQGASLNADPLVVHSTRKMRHPKLASAPIEKLEDVKERFGKSFHKRHHPGSVSRGGYQTRQQTSASGLLAPGYKRNNL